MSSTSFARFLLGYRFAIQEVETKLSILQQDFRQLHRYSPIEHVSSRLKSPESIVAKARKLGVGPDVEQLREHVRDIAGVRVVCSFLGDVPRVQQLLCSQDDLELVELEDYVSSPKPSGYRCLHAIVMVPVFLSDGTVQVPVELQFRTIAQDFWASLEHKIFYKYAAAVPPELREELVRAAATAHELDSTMERLAVEIHGEGISEAGPEDSVERGARALMEFLGE